MLAAWGYESGGGGGNDRLEVDVWTVNRTEREEPLPDPSDLVGPVADVLGAVGNVAKVEYAGAAGVGYQYVDPSAANDPNADASDATAQAYAGAARAAGGDRTGAGTFGDGAEPVALGPVLADVREHGRQEVLPVVQAELPELGSRLTPDAEREEDEEPVTSRPFDGYRNVVRVMPSTGGTYRYRVSGAALERVGAGAEP